MSDSSSSSLVKPIRRRGVAGAAALALNLMAAIGVALAAPGPAPRAEPSCIVLWGRNYSPTDLYDPRHACGTCGGQRAQPALCGTLNQTMLPDWSATNSLIAVPHRGLWGQPLSRGAPENTLDALYGAWAGHYRVIEIDVALTGPDPSGVRQVFLGHYFTLAASNDSPGLDPSTLPPATVFAEHMNYRDQTSSTGDQSKLLSFRDALQFAKSNNIILMIDPKVPAGAPTDSISQIMAYVLNEAYGQAALQNIVLKTQQERQYTINTMAPYLTQTYTTLDGQFLWSPITAGNAEGANLNDILAFVRAWDAATLNSKQILVYETNLFSPNYVASKPFTSGGRTYNNLIDFVRLLTPLGKRSALWSIDPAGNKGTLGRVYNWKFIGNTPDDQRGNPLITLGYDSATHAMITTDRPDQFLALVNQ